MSAEFSFAFPLLVLAAGLVLILFEMARPGRRWPEVRGWYVRALLLNSFQIIIVFAAGRTWDQSFIHDSLLSDRVSVPIQGLLGYFILTFVYYWWHRWRHECSFLWKWLHQIHHSAQRIEILTSFYKHPLEMLINNVLNAFLLYGVLGLHPQAAAGSLLLAGLAELFYHWNIETPRWLGYLIQRPESHCIHHEEGVHNYNYSDLPLWDFIFGTYLNPVNWRGACGLGPQVEHRLSELLVGKQLS